MFSDPEADSRQLEAEYFYDAFGRRVAKRVRTIAQAQATGTDGAAGSTAISDELTLFVWDSDRLLQEGRGRDRQLLVRTRQLRSPGASTQRRRLGRSIAEAVGR